MTVKELKERLSVFPDDCQVVFPDGDYDEKLLAPITKFVAINGVDKYAVINHKHKDFIPYHWWSCACRYAYGFSSMIPALFY